MAPHGIVGISRFFVHSASASCRCFCFFVQMLCHVACGYAYYCLRALPCLYANILAHSGKLNTSASCRCFCFFVQMLCHVAWQYVNYCLRALPCLCAKILAHSGKLNTSASCEWGSATSKQRSFCANAVSCRLWVSILLPARPSLPLRKDPRPQRQAQRLGGVRVGECYVKTAVFLCKCRVMPLDNIYYCLRALPCLCAKIHAHSGKLNTSASCEWGSTTSKQRFFSANISPRRLANYKLFRAGI